MSAALRVLRAELIWIRGMRYQAEAERDTNPRLAAALEDQLTALALEETDILDAIYRLSDGETFADPRQPDLFGATLQ